MDYVKEVYAFFNELETNPLSSSAIALYHALLHMNSKCGWKDKFSVPVGTLSLKSGLSDRSITNARNELKTKGYIDFNSRSGNKSAIYSITSLSAIFADKLSDNVSCNASDKLSDNVSALKRFKDSSSTASTVADYESIYSAHRRIFGYDCNPFQIQKMGSYIDDGMEEAVVIRAMERAASAASAFNFRLVYKIIEDYLHAGALTLDAAIAFDAAFEARKNGPALQVVGGNAKPKSRYEQEMEELQRAKEEAMRREGISGY